LLDAEEVVVAPGVIDPLTARLVERLGFDALYLGGHSMGIHLGEGQPLTTMSEAIAIADRVGAETTAPVILDGGAGFGDVAQVDRLVREAERAGVAAVHIEDQPYPKLAGYHRGEGTLASVEVTVAKLRAAVAARRELLVIARTDVLRVTGSTAEMLERCAAFAAAGADALIVLDLEPPAAAELRDRLPDLPLIWIGAVADPGPSLDEMRAAGFSLALYPFNTVAAIIDAVAATWRPLLERGRLEQAPELLARARAEALELTRIPRAWEVEAAAEGGGRA
jgi:methylisocitrate lyase